jgi:ribA/ribD-fused uncharacterized protein
MSFTLDDARQAEAAGDRLRFLFFWGHRAERDGSIGPGSLSQWWPAEFTVDGVRYPTAEHYMMRAKALLFDDAEIADRVADAGSPGAAKALGRKVRDFDEAVWAEHRTGIVVTANQAKFGQNPSLLRYLIATGDRILVEASPLDRVWGIGLAATDAGATRPSVWPGLNLLGFALMEVRDALNGQ